VDVGLSENDNKGSRSDVLHLSSVDESGGVLFPNSKRGKQPQITFNYVSLFLYYRVVASRPSRPILKELIALKLLKFESNKLVYFARHASRF
jgi:hypothetical protein